MHRIWAFVDKESYAKFWISVLENKGAFYFILMGFLALLCICGIVTFFRNLRNNYWWRWIYFFGGLYLLFDLFAIAINLQIWNDLLLFMFDIDSPFWNLIWGFFIALGTFVLCLGIKLFKQTSLQLEKIK